jgi:tetratricopeptide (TPR) repeat protein
MRVVWTDTYVDEGSLNRNISTLRKALGDDLHEQRFIKTIPKQGYRFTADVKEIFPADGSLEPAIDRFPNRIATGEVGTSRKFSRIVIVAIIVGLGVVGSGFILKSAWTGDKQPATLLGAKSAESFEAYIQGRELWQTRDAEDLHRATVLLEGVVQRDPDFALAHAALADAYAFDYRNWKLAEEQARSAIRLDSNLGEPHATLGFIRMFWQWDLNAAETEFKEAVRLSPEYATGRQWYALNLAAMGQRDAAIVEIKKAIEIEPTSVAINSDYCQLLYYAERYEAAEQQCRKTLEINPQYQAARELLYEIYMTAEMYDNAVNQFAQLQSESKSDRIRAASEQLRKAFIDGGIKGFRRAQIDFYTHTDPSFYKLARVLAEDGQTEASLAALHKAAENNDFDFVFFIADPFLTELAHGQARDELVGRLIKQHESSENLIR